MKHLVIGLGEVGAALQEILSCDGIDAGKGQPNAKESQYDMLHICFPYSEMFGQSVKEYQKMFDPMCVVVHSTVPIGTCRALKVAHSPIRGKHPNLKESILKFKKFVGGHKADMAAAEMGRFDIMAKVVESSDDTEAGKLFDLMQYGLSILTEKAIYQFCKENNLDFKTVYMDFNKSYNRGYTRMGMANVIRPVLEHRDGKIGGHCVVQMMEYLDHPLAEDIINQNNNL